MESYKHIELTQEEADKAVLDAKIRKEKIIQEAERERIAAENRKAFTSNTWTSEQTKGYFKYRWVSLFKGHFKIDDSNTAVFELLCRYFSNDKEFISMAEGMGIENASLDKGILLAGNFGTGKTWMMRLMQKNNRQCYVLKSAKDIANEFEADGQEAVNPYVNKIKNAVNDKDFFYQGYCGLCIDDLGTENIKNNYGNRKNVIGDLIELRYDAGNTGVFLHATTNLNAEGIKEFYGGRVVSRLRQIFNIILLNGEDRRV